jgi:cytochrome c biogenesis protein CcmG/thiol:disulfide interchange protein DsbE
MFCNGRMALILMLISVWPLALAGCHKSSSNTGAATPIVSRPPQTSYPLPPVKAANPNLGWTLTNDQHIKLSDYQNKVVVLDFYATWCEPCRDSIPHLVDLQTRYGPQGLQIVGLNVGGADDIDKVTGFAREFHIQYPLGIPDPEMETLYLGGDDAIPQTFVLDRKGQLLKRFVGYDDSMAEELERAIQSSLGPTKEQQAGQ